MISLRNYYGSTVQTADSKFRFCMLLVFHWWRLPAPCFIHVHLLHFHLQYEKQYQKHLEIDVYQIYNFCPVFDPVGQKKKVRREKIYTLSQEDGGGQKMRGKEKEKKTKWNNKGTAPHRAPGT